jgi:hypothetical protein
MVESIKSGDYSMKKEWGTGDKQAAMGKNFEKFLPMLNAMPGDTSAERMTALDAMFRASKTVREWEVEMKAAGIPYSPPGNTAKDAVVYGSSTLGPKIGNGFWQNLNGNFDPLTIDLWMRRTWGRLTGKSIGQPDAVPAQRRRLKAAISKSRSNEQGSPDLIEAARSDLASSEAALEAHKSGGQLEGQTKKDFSAETRRLNKEVSEGKALLSDLAGLKAPGPWKAEYGKTDDALLAYSKRLITAWSKEYKRLQETYGSANIPTELQPTWARAAKAIKSNLSTPLDQIANGTQRKQVEAVGQRAREILSERGIDVTTADLQALLWYPEKELWGGLRDELEVDADGIPVVTANSLNESYDTTFARIFRSQGYEVEGIEGDGAGGSGQGAVSGQDAGSVGPEGTAGTGQAGVQDNGRELFQEVDFVGDVIFEVAPDPNNVELSARWNALPPAAQLAISDTVAKSVLPSVLEAAEAEGSVSPQIGSYLEDTNPSFSLRLTSGDPAAVANAVGFVLSQDSMVALSADAFEGSFEAGAVRIQVGDKSLQEIDAIYQTLRGIEGFPQIGGQSTTDGQMTLILEEGVDPRGFADAVDNALASEYDVKAARLQAAFPEKKDYDYASDRNDPAGSAGVARQRYRAVRVQASQEVAAAIDQYERGGQQPAVEQTRTDGPRGSFRQERDTYGNLENVIRLTENADRTTFLHELGHFWLFQLSDTVNDPRMTGRGKARREKMLQNTTEWFYSERKAAWKDIRGMATRAEAAAKKAPEDADKVLRAKRLAAAVAHARENGGEAYMGKVARGFMSGGLDYSADLEVAFHEIWARGSEMYFAEGRAPSAALDQAFGNFSTWIIGVYKKLRNLNVNLTPEVRGVFDRLLATEEEINAQEQRAAYQVPSDVEQYATNTEKARLRELTREAEVEARAEMQGRVARELRRERTAQYRDARQRVTETVTAEVKSRPLYRALSMIRRGIDQSGNILLADDQGKATPLKLDRKEVQRLFGTDVVRRMRGLVTKKGETAYGTVPEMAGYAGFSNAAELVDALSHPYVSERDMIDKEVQAQLDARFGKILNDQQVADDAADVVANDKQLDLISLQAKILRRKANDPLNAASERQALEEGAPSADVDRAAVEDADRAQGDAQVAEDAVPEALRFARAQAQQKANARQRQAQFAARKKLAQLTRSIDIATVKEAASRYVQTIRVREATPARYRATADRLSKRIEKAIASRDYDEAAALMQQKLLNIAISKEAADVQKKVDRGVKRFRRILNKSDKKLTGTYDINIINAMRVALEPYGLADFKSSNFNPEQALSYLNEINPAQYTDLVKIIGDLTAEADAYLQINPARAYREMSVEKFNQLISAASSMITEARAGESLLIDGRRVAHEEINAEISAASSLMVKKGKTKLYRGTAAQRAKLGFAGTIRAYTMRVESFGRMMDGGFGGPFHKYVVQPIMAATTEYNTERQKPILRMVEALKAHRGRLASSGPITGPGGYVFQNKTELIHAILHTGNPSNKRKLLLGGAVDVGTGDIYTFGELDAEGELDTTRWDAFMDRMFEEGTVTKEDMDLVAEIWSIFNETKKGAQAAHNRMFGYYFTEIKPEPVSTPFGVYEGGYVPAVTDSMMNEDAGTQLDAEAIATQQNASMFPGAEAGFTKGRVEYNKPLNLDLLTIAAHYDRVAKFTYLGPAVRDVARLVLSPGFKNAVGKVDSTAVAGAIIPWLQRTVNQQTAQRTSGQNMDRVFSKLSTRVGMDIMAGNVVNAAQQLTGVISSWVIVKPKYTASAFKVWKNNPDTMKEYVANKSPFMQNRMYDSVNDMMVEAVDILTDKTPLEKTQHFSMKYAYFAQQYTQNLVDPIVWMAAEQQALSEGLWETVYNDNVHKGVEKATAMAEASVAQYADSVVRQTQTPLKAEDRSRVETLAPFIGLFMKFYSYGNNMYNLNRTEWKLMASEVGWKGKPGRAFYLYLMGIAIPAIIAQAITSGIKGAFEDAEEEEMPYTYFELLLLSQVKFVAGFAPGGTAAASLAIGQFTPQFYDDRLSMSAPVSFVETVVKGGFNVGNAIHDKITGENDPDVARALKDALRLIGLSIGVPTSWFAKPVSYLTKVSEGKADPEGVKDYVRGFLTGRDGTEKKR